MPNIKSNTEQKRLWSYKPTEEDFEAARYCLNKGIHISLLAIHNDRLNYKIEIINWSSGKPVRKESPTTYPIDKVVEKIYKYYNWYYQRRNEK